ncbi:MAG: DnaJ domain-containing protein [Fimbriimonadales bacterium]|nr:DnaJ domain-containing protein [Fimbriimonadales bacterium]
MQNHYEVLGLSMHATQEAVRRRYRELVRQYHPDVNPSPQAQEQFLRIQEAYQVLSDPERRKHYDALLRLRQGEPPSARYSQPRTRPAQPQTAQQSRPQPSSPPADELRRLIIQAERAFLQGRMQDALYWAKQATRLAPRHAKGHEIIGDVYRTQGHYDAALNAYTYAIQLDPHNPDLQRKLDAMLERTQSKPAPPSPVIRNLPVLKLPPEWKLYAAQSLGWGAVLFLLALAYTVPGTPLLLGWSLNLLAYLGLGGFLTGFLMAVSRWVAPIGDAFPWRRRGGQISAGGVLAALSAVCFPLAVLLYTLLALTQGGLSRSVARVFSVGGALTLGFALLYPHDWLFTALFGGNLLFLALLGGWYLADNLRLAP